MREITTLTQRDSTILELQEKLESRMKEKGNHSFASIHEILGVIAEEYDELKDAVRENNHKQVKRELLDIAVSCVFGITCIDNNMLDW